MTSPLSRVTHTLRGLVDRTEEASDEVRRQSQRLQRLAGYQEHHSQQGPPGEAVSPCHLPGHNNDSRVARLQPPILHGRSASPGRVSFEADRRSRGGGMDGTCVYTATHVGSCDDQRQAHQLLQHQCRQHEVVNQQQAHRHYYHSQYGTHHPRQPSAPSNLPLQPEPTTWTGPPSHQQQPESSYQVHVELQRCLQSTTELRGQIESLKSQLAWQEREKGRVHEQNSRLHSELDAAMAEVRQLREAAHERVGEQQEALEGRKEEVAALERENAELVKRLDSLEATRADMRQHITRLDMYLVNMARELDDARKAKTDAEHRCEQLRKDLDARAQAMGVLSLDLNGLSKVLQRVQNTRRSSDRVLANLQVIVDRFRSCSVVTPADLGQKLVATLIPRGAEDSKPGVDRREVEDIGFDLRRWLAEAQSLCPQLLDEVAAGRRESEFLSSELQELSTRIGKAVARTSSAASKQQDVGLAAQAGRAASSVAAAADARESEAVVVRLQELDETADETAQMLRGLVRSRVTNVQVLLRTAHEQQADLMAEVERLRKDATGARAAAADAEKARAELEQEVAKLKREVDEGAATVRQLEDALRTREDELSETRTRAESIHRDGTRALDVESDLRAALSDALKAKGEMEAEMHRQQQRVQALEADLDTARCQHSELVETVTASRASLDAAMQREVEALELLRTSEERLVAAERGRDRLIEGTLTYMEEAEAKQAILAAWRAWAQESARGTRRRLRLCLTFRMGAQIREAQIATDAATAEVDLLTSKLEEMEKVVADLETREGAAKQDLELEARKRIALGEALAEVAGSRQVLKKGFQAMQGWRSIVQERKHKRKIFALSLRQYVTAKRLRIARMEAVAAEARADELSSSLQQMAEGKQRDAEVVHAEFERLAQEKVAAEEQLERVRVEVDDLERKWEEGMEQRTMGLRGELLRQQEVVKTLESQLALSQADARGLSVRLREAEEEVIKLTNQSQVMEAEKGGLLESVEALERLREQQEEEYQEQASEQDARISEMEQARVADEQAIRELREALATKEQQLASLSRARVELEQELQQIHTAQDERETELSRLRHELDSTTQKLERVKAQHEQFCRELELDDDRREEDVRRTVAAQEAAIVELKRQLASEIGEKTDMVTMHEREVDRFKRVIEERGDEILRFTRVIKERDNEVARLLALQAQHAQEYRVSQGMANEELLQTRAAKEASVFELQQARQHAQDELDAATRAKAEADRELQRMRVEQDDYERELMYLRQEHEAKVQEMRQLHAMQEESERQLRDSARLQEADHVRATREAAAVEFAQVQRTAQQELATVSRAREEMEVELQRMRAAQEEQKLELKYLRRDYDAKNEEVQRLKAMQEEHDRELRESTRQEEAQRGQIVVRELEHQLDVVSKAKDEAEVELRRLQVACEEDVRELGRLRIELQARDDEICTLRALQKQHDGETRASVTAREEELQRDKAAREAALLDVQEAHRVAQDQLAAAARAKAEADRELQRMRAAQDDHERELMYLRQEHEAKVQEMRRVRAMQEDSERQLRESARLQEADHVRAAREAAAVELAQVQRTAQDELATVSRARERMERELQEMRAAQEEQKLELTYLRRDYDAKNEEVQRLKVMQEEHDRELRESTRQEEAQRGQLILHELEQQLISASRARSEAEVELRRLHVAREEDVRELGRLRMEAQARDDEIRSLRALQEQHQEEYRASQAAREEELQRVKAGREAALLDVQEAHRVAREQLAAAARAKEEADRELQRMRSAQEQRERDLSRLQEEHEEKIQEMQRLRAMQEEHYRQLRDSARAEEAEHVRAAREAAVFELQQAQWAAQQELATMSRARQDMEGEVQRLRIAQQQREEVLDHLTMEPNVKNDEVQRLKVVQDEHDKQLRDSVRQEEAERSKGVIRDLQQQFTSTTLAKDDLERQLQRISILQTEREKELAELRAEQQASAAEVTRLRHALRQQEQQVAGLRHEQAARDEELASLRLASQSPPPEVAMVPAVAVRPSFSRSPSSDGEDTELLRTKLGRSEEERLNLARQLGEAKEEVSRLQEQVRDIIENVRKEATELERIETLKALVEKLTTQLEASQREVLRLREDHRVEMQRTQDDYRAEMTRLLKARTDGTTPRMSHGEGPAEDVADRSADHQEREVALRKELDSRATTIRQLKDTVAQQKRDIRALTQKSNAAEARVASALERANEADSNLRAAEAEISNIKKVLKELQERYAVLADECEKLRADAVATAAPASRQRPAQSHCRMAGDATSPESAQPRSMQVELSEDSASREEVLLAEEPVQPQVDNGRRSGGRSHGGDLRRALRRAEQEKAELSRLLDEALRERNELLQLCHILRDEIVATAEGTLDVLPASTTAVMHQPVAPGVTITINSPGKLSRQVIGESTELEKLQAELERLGRQLSHEASMRQELEAEVERVKAAGEQEGLDVQSESMSEAVRRRDQAVRMAHNLEVELRRSQERIAYLISENASIKDGLHVLEHRIAAVHEPPSSDSSRRRPSSRQAQAGGTPQHTSSKHRKRKDRAPLHTSGGSYVEEHPHACLEPEWSPSSNVIMKQKTASDNEGSHGGSQDHEKQGHASFNSSSGDSALQQDDEDCGEHIHELGAIGGRAFLIGSRAAPLTDSKRRTQTPRGDVVLGDYVEQLQGALRALEQSVDG